MPDTPPRRVALEAVRAAWGLACLLAPDAVVTRVGGARPDSRARVVTRILGARHLTQAALSGIAPTPGTLAVGVWVDGVHSLTALGLAALDPSRARPALTDAVGAALWAAAGDRDLRRERVGPPRGRRERLARAVLPLLPLAPRLDSADGGAGR